MSLFDKAAGFAAAAHIGQLRRYTNEPYITHPLAVAELVRATGAREAVVAAAVLHDVLEDTGITVDELRAAFGDEIADLVVAVTNVYRSGTPGSRAVRKAREANRLSTVCADAQTIKVADVLHNTMTLAERDPKFAATYLPEKAALLTLLTKADPTLRAKAREIKR